MKATIRNITDIKPTQEAPGVTVREAIRVEEAPRFYMRIYELEPGGATQIHTHWWEHELFVLSGQGLIDNGQEQLPMKQNDAINIEQYEPHRFVNNGTQLLRYILLNPRNK